MNDGDTVTCQNRERIRLLLIDAPEMDQGPFGEMAKRVLEELVSVGDTVGLELDVQKRDRYRRVLAYLYSSDGRMVNRELARQGFVVPLVYPPNVRHVELIRAAVDSAKAEEVGLWQTSAFECEPREFRRGTCG